MRPSSKVSQRQIDDANSDIVEVISRYVQLKKTGKNWSACCPFHDEKSPSFSVSESKQLFKCFGCGAGGDAVKFVQEYCNVSFREAVETINGSLELERDVQFVAPIKRAVRCSLPGHCEDKEKSGHVINRLLKAETHPYFVSRNTAPQTFCLVNKGKLMVPLYNTIGEPVNVAALDQAGNVTYLAGGPSYNAVASIPALEGKHDGRVLLCSDYGQAWRVWWREKGRAAVKCCIGTGLEWYLANCKSEFTHVCCDPLENEWFASEGFQVVECGLDPYSK